MFIVDKIIKLFSNQDEKGLIDEKTYQVLMSNIAHLLSLFFMLLFGVIALIKEHYVHSTFLFVTSILLIINYYILERTQKVRTTSVVLVSLISVILLYLFTNGLTEGTGSLWLFLYPMMCIFLLGLKLGSIYFFGVFVIINALLFIPYFEFIQQDYSDAYKLRFIITFVAVYGITYFYEYVRMQNRKLLDKHILEAQNLNQSKTEFISRLSHQLRTPLNSILGLTNLLKNSSLSKTQLEYVETLETSANNIISSVKDIVEVAREITPAEKFNDLSFELQQTIKEVMLLFKKHNQEIEVKYNLAYSKFIPKKIIGSPVKVKQVIYNIIETCLLSASKNSLVFDIYANNKKETDIAIEVLFEIHTSTVEVPEDVLNQPYESEKLFHYFDENSHQNSDKLNSQNIDVNETIKKFNLSISQEIVELYGGRIGVNKKESGIIVFWFTMLFWKMKKENINVKEQIRQPDSEKNTGIIVKKKLKNANILIVEDNLINQKVLNLGLKGFVNSIDSAHNGKEAVDMFSKSKYDIVLLDIQMPIMDGYKTARKLRELETANNIHTPIIAMTANAMDGDKDKCLREGMDDYISKPYQMDYLIKRMEYYLSKSSK